MKRSEVDTGKREGLSSVGRQQALVSTQGNDEEFENIRCPAHNQRQSFFKQAGRVGLDVQWRHFFDGWIVTVSPCNAQDLTDTETGRDYSFERAKKPLFEASLRCVIASGEIGVYPRVDRSLLDPEEQKIELQYAHRHIHAVRHGCAADWELQDGKVNALRSETMPAVEVPQMTADTGSGSQPVLALARLAKIDNMYPAHLPGLAAFVDEYADWVTSQQGRISVLPLEDHAVGNPLVARMNRAVSRMRAGLHLPGRECAGKTGFRSGRLHQTKSATIAVASSLPRPIARHCTRIAIGPYSELIDYTSHRG